MEENQVKCPHCGHEFDLPLEPMEKHLLKTVKKLERHSGIASTQAIAVEVAFSAAHVRRQLAVLERQGKVRRVGQRKGWKSAA